MPSDYGPPERRGCISARSSDVTRAPRAERARGKRGSNREDRITTKERLNRIELRQKVMLDILLALLARQAVEKPALRKIVDRAERANAEIDGAAIG